LCNPFFTENVFKRRHDARKTSDFLIHNFLADKGGLRQPSLLAIGEIYFAFSKSKHITFLQTA